MTRTRPAVFVAATITALAIVCAGAAGAQAASAKTITACVNKKSGATKILLTATAKKKKCAKGWSKVTWNVAGTPGKTGAAGANGTNGTNGTNGKDLTALSVRNADGSVLGTFAGIIPSTLPAIQVVIDGGAYAYVGSGQLLGQTSPTFLTSDCSGPAYIGSFLDYDSVYAKLIGGTTRIVFRPFGAGGTFGTPRVWKLAATHPTVLNQDAWELNSSTGACQASASSPVSGMLIGLTEIAPPPDGVGPLTVS